RPLCAVGQQRASAQGVCQPAVRGRGVRVFVSHTGLMLRGNRRKCGGWTKLFASFIKARDARSLPGIEVLRQLSTRNTAPVLTLPTAISSGETILKEAVLAEQHGVIIIGAGGAGLSASYYLKQLGVTHTVLERGDVGNTWAQERWDSFHL